MMDLTLMGWSDCTLCGHFHPRGIICTLSLLPTLLPPPPAPQLDSGTKCWDQKTSAEILDDIRAGFGALSRLPNPVVWQAPTHAIDFLSGKICKRRYRRECRRNRLPVVHRSHGWRRHRRKAKP